MPLYRYECRACAREREVLHGLDETAPACECGGSLRRLMPRRVRGRVVEPGQVAAERADEARAEAAAKLRSAEALPSDPGAMAIPPASWSGPPSSRAERDARWRDTTEAMAAWQTRSLVADGVDYTTAKRKAERHQQQVSAQAEASDTST